MPSEANVAVGGKVTAAHENSQTGWVNAMGAIMVVPTSTAVAGGGATSSVSTKGRVTFAAATSVSVNGCFTTTYDNYLILITSSQTAAADISIRMRLAGTDASTGVYFWAGLTGNGATATSPGATSATSFPIVTAVANAGLTSQSITAFRPAVAASTTFVASAMLVNNTTGGMVVTTRGGLHNISTIYDGISFIAGSGTITGDICVYGYNKG